MGKLYTGIALFKQSQPDLTNAGKALDDVMAQGFSGNSHRDHFVLFAAKWRISIDLATGSNNQAVQIVTWVQNSNCPKALKKDFLVAYGPMAGLKNN